MAILHDDRLFPVEPSAQKLAASLYRTVQELPIISPHGHVPPVWFAENEPFSNPTALLIEPDHYIYRMLYSQGVSLESLGIPQIDSTQDADPREVWRIFAKHYYLFRGTPSRLWLDYTFEKQFGLKCRLSAETADTYYDTIAEKLKSPSFRPRALFEQFRIETLATTDPACDDLHWHSQLRESGWKGRIIPTFRPDSVIDAEWQGFQQNINKLGELTGEDVTHYKGYLNALKKQRAFFKDYGATATDHGHVTAMSADLCFPEAARLYERLFTGKQQPGDATLFQAQMLTEMAAMSVEDGLVMQIHPGSLRNHNKRIYERFGRDRGADIPVQAEYVRALRPLLDKFGNEPGFTLILFTLDESTYTRELAPLAGHYPCLKLGPPWWFHDSVEGMMRFRESVTSTAGFYNTVGFNDDTRALLSIPARHDVARRMDAAFLARLVMDHRLEEDEAFEVIQDLTINLVKKAYKL